MKNSLLITCEHGGNKIPTPYWDYFRSREARQALSSHRGFDHGALSIAKFAARLLDAPLFVTDISRLLIDANRSAGNPTLHSEFSRRLTKLEKEKIASEHHRPYQGQIESHIRGQIERGHRVCHLSIHSFTPKLYGKVRRCDIGLLYDPKRKREKAVCERARELVRPHFANPRARPLCVHLNAPYRGNGDGLTSELRKEFAPASYCGLELEFNHALLFEGLSMRELYDPNQSPPPLPRKILSQIAAPLLKAIVTAQEEILRA